MAMPLTTCVILRNLFNFFEVQISHLQHKNFKSTYIRVIW